MTNRLHLFAPLRIAKQHVPPGRAHYIVPVNSVPSSYFFSSSLIFLSFLSSIILPFFPSPPLSLSRPPFPPSASSSLSPTFFPPSPHLFLRHMWECVQAYYISRLSHARALAPTYRRSGDARNTS
ncbi:hypothetical protein BDQ17DRAFT_1441185 [Cyathus striatus]|nr:hypothetical protein BDQ17DRAFT_1441185 [Cyathus striatus]